MDKQEIISSLENFYEVWSDGVSGNVIDVQKRLSDYEVISRQQAKKIISSPTKLREESSKQNSLLELRELEKTGLKCTLIHVGPRLLDQYAVKIIFQYLSDYPDAYISEKKPGTYGIVSNGREVDLGFENEYFYLYLACIRYLAREGKIK